MECTILEPAQHIDLLEDPRVTNVQAHMCQFDTMSQIGGQRRRTMPGEEADRSRIELLGSDEG